MNAALGNHAEMVKILLQAGADVNAVDAQGCTALDAAEAACSRECVRLLLHYGAAPDLEDEIDETPLEAAEETGQEECAKLIREAMG